MEDTAGQVGEIGEIGDLRATSRGSRNWSATRNRSAQRVGIGVCADITCAGSPRIGMQRFGAVAVALRWCDCPIPGLRRGQEGQCLCRERPRSIARAGNH